MVKVVTRIIEGIRYRCRDLGCDDPERAEYNRFIIANKLFTTFYELVETWFRHTPLYTPLPSWMPIGELPEVGKKDWQQYGGGKAGLREEEE